MELYGEKDGETIKYDEYPYLLYVRVSTDKDEQKDSVPNQIDICRYWIEKNNFEWNENSILKDDGLSGTYFLERKAMQLILKKARNREIKMVVFKSIHRLARDLKDALEIKEVLIGHGVRVVTMEENYDSHLEGKNDMKFEMYSMFAAQYPKTLSVSISASLAAKVRRGDHIGKIPFGYDRINHKLVIKEAEAEVIRKIFNWYTKDKIGFKSITNKLNEGVENGTILPPKESSYWGVTSVQRIIKSPIFCGTFILNKYTNIKVDGRKKQIKNPREKWNVFEDHHPAIVSKKQWNEANNKDITKFNTKISEWNEFRGLMKCSECGSNIVTMVSYKRRKSDDHKTTFRYLKCSAYRRGGKAACVNHTPITYEDFREFILNSLIKKWNQVELDFENNLGKNTKSLISNLNQQKIQLEKKKNRLVDMYLNEMLDKEDYLKRKSGFEIEIEKVENELYLNSSIEHKQVQIRTVKEAFSSLKKTDQDLTSVFKEIIDNISIAQNGEIEITYRIDPSL
ncbi:recombinase family protein [Halobacillus kuroshimensis]|uniref:Recombinase family protein n=1 Tax=Halobacillus kuroshimensis TaxID=302481 RepID=A0ABS3DZP5_9BACI|nr:recombinase family protein [Halobacillus kuroshimensis]MBN8236818.1 recombinase family protein [Halobacillus kuroshimensis]